MACLQQGIPVGALLVPPAQPLEDGGEDTHHVGLAQKLLHQPVTDDLFLEVAGPQQLQGMVPHGIVIQARLQALHPVHHQVDLDGVQRPG